MIRRLRELDEWEIEMARRYPDRRDRLTATIKECHEIIASLGKKR